MPPTHRHCFVSSEDLRNFRSFSSQSAKLRDFLLQLACAGFFRARWTNAIHDEWIRNLLEERPDLDPIALLCTRQLMDRVVPDCLIESYESLIQGLALPDPNDRHV